MTDWEAQYNPRESVPDFERYVKASKTKSDLAYARFNDIEEHRYGPSPLATLDLRRASEPGRPVFVFIHGGYWRGRDKRDFGYVFTGLEYANVNVVLLNYDLCPNVTVAQICTQIQQAVLWLNAHAPELGFDANQLFLAGHSAGAHLVAMVLAQPPAAFSIPDGLIKKAYLMSGIYELSPVLRVSVNDEIKLSENDIEAVSPVNFPPARQTAYDVIVGSAEPEGWIAQSVDFERYLRRSGASSTFTLQPDRHHYSILQDLETPSGALMSRFIHDMTGGTDV